MSDHLDPTPIGEYAEQTSLDTALDAASVPYELIAKNMTVVGQCLYNLEQCIKGGEDPTAALKDTWSAFKEMAKGAPIDVEGATWNALSYQRPEVAASETSGAGTTTGLPAPR